MVYNDLVLGSARIDPMSDGISQDIVNIHFNFIPNPTMSPSLNLLDLWERVDSNEELRNTIKGIFLRLNVAQRSLYFYGSFFMSDQGHIDTSLASLRNAGVRANRATFLSFLLRENDALFLKNMSNGIAVANESYLEVSRLLVDYSRLTRLKI